MSEPVGSAVLAPELTSKKDPNLPLPASFVGFHFGDSYAQAEKTCSASGHAFGVFQREGRYASAECGGVPAPELGLDGESVDVTFCPWQETPAARVCEISLHVSARPATQYRAALEALTQKYGKPSETVATPPADDEAANRTCAGDGAIASATWRWREGIDGSLDATLDCFGKHPWVWVTVMDSDGVARYRDQQDSGI